MTSQSAAVTIDFQKRENSFLRLSLNRKIQVLLSAQHVTEIVKLTPQRIVPIPDVAVQVMGVCDWRGEVIWLADLAYLLRCKPLYQLKYSQTEYSALMINYDGIHMGLVIHQVHQMQNYDATHMLPPDIKLPVGALRLPHVAGYLHTPSQAMLPVLDCASLLPRFQSSSV